jgi:hypothetical protein
MSRGRTMSLYVGMLSVLLVAASGCVRTLEPVLKDDQAIYNKSLSGKWVGGEKATESLEISGNEDQKTYAVVYTDKDGKQGSFDARLGKIGGNLIAEIRPGEFTPLDKAPDAYKVLLLPAYSFLAVTLTPTRLEVSMMDDKWFKKYIEEHPGELRTVSSKSHDLEGTITSSTEELQAFLAKHWKDEKVWNEPAIFVRPGDPATHPATGPAIQPVNVP